MALFHDPRRLSFVFVFITNVSTILTRRMHTRSEIMGTIPVIWLPELLCNILM